MAVATHAARAAEVNRRGHDAATTGVAVALGDAAVGDAAVAGGVLLADAAGEEALVDPVTGEVPDVEGAPLQATSVAATSAAVAVRPRTETMRRGYGDRREPLRSSIQNHPGADLVSRA